MVDRFVEHLAVAGVLAQHMGALHAYEKWLTLAIAFGPFLVLGVVVVLRQRADARDEAETGPQDGPAA